jgi:hypothetical protein
VIDAQSNYADDGKRAVDDQRSYFYPSELSRKFSGSILLVLGSIVGIGANFALRWTGRNHWVLAQRLALGIFGWGIAVILVCHGAGLLLGINRAQGRPGGTGNFKQLATAILQAPRPKIKTKMRQLRAATSRRLKSADKD